MTEQIEVSIVYLVSDSTYNPLTKKSSSVKKKLWLQQLKDIYKRLELDCLIGLINTNAINQQNDKYVSVPRFSFLVNY